MNNPPRILIVEDEELALANLEHILKKQNYEIVTAGTGTMGLELVRAERFDVVLTDLRMEKVDGMKILEESRKLNPSCEVIMITGYATVDSAIEAMKKGAYHYISKPYRVEAVRKIVAEALEKIRLRDENVQLKEDLKKLKKASAVQIITKDPAMTKILATAAQIAATDCNVLITGESGTGKELLARFIHEHSPRRAGPFLALNCGVFNEELLTNELFGHEKGAFTGACSRKTGKFEFAHGSTLFLDEIGDMSLAVQAKLLRVIELGTFQRVGGNDTLQVDVRLITATNRDLRQEIGLGRFREDLYYRINVVEIALPPLRQRREDIPLLADFFVRRFARRYQKPLKGI
ncbi:MAG: sigma-54-dependent transcriptional regulator, partial [Desulfomonilaceae bacterium]